MAASDWSIDTLPALSLVNIVGQIDVTTMKVSVYLFIFHHMKIDIYVNRILYNINRYEKLEYYY